MQLVVFVASQLVHRLDAGAHEAAGQLIQATGGSPPLPLHLQDREAQQLVTCFVQSYSAQLAAANPAPAPVQQAPRPLPIPGLAAPAFSPQRAKQQPPQPQAQPALQSSSAPAKPLPATAPPPSHRAQAASRPAHQAPKPAPHLTPAPARASTPAPAPSPAVAHVVPQAPKQQAGQAAKAACTPGPAGEGGASSNLAEQERILALYRERRRQELEDIEFARRLQVGP